MNALFERHIVALAAEMRLPVVEVFEVASFYHHFQILKDEQVPPRVTVRVCDSLSCQLAGSDSLLARLQQELGGDVQVMAAPCLGRCEQAPAAQVGQKAVAAASVDSLKALVQAQDLQPHALAKALDLQVYRAAGGYSLLQQLASGQRSAESVIEVLEHNEIKKSIVQVSFN